jgi:hypothetical protein
MTPLDFSATSAFSALKDFDVVINKAFRAGRRA